MQQPEVPIKVDVLPGEYKYVITPLRGPADTAYVVGSIGRFQFKNKKQTYVHLLNEVKEQQIVRQSACRMATYKVDEVVETYVCCFLHSEMTSIMSFKRKQIEA